MKITALPALKIRIFTAKDAAVLRLMCHVVTSAQLATRTTDARAEKTWKSILKKAISERLALL